VVHALRPGLLRDRIDADGRADIDRFGAVPRATPCQSDLIIVARHVDL
jgi:NADH:ubiquinone oxidoreductase subunit B-like Fe-S oxidoreductase